MKKFIILCSMFIAAVMLCPIAFAEGTYEYAVDAITAVDLDNKPIEYQSGSCSAKINVSRNFVRAGADEDYLVVSAYDTEARLVGFYTVSTDSFAANKPASVSCLINVDKEVELGRISAYVWDNFDGIKPLSKVKNLIFNTGSVPDPIEPPLPEGRTVYVDGALVAANDGSDRKMGLYDNMLRIKNSKESMETTDYALDDNAKLYVNNCEYLVICGNEFAARDLIAESRGSTALVDVDSDGCYDGIIIDYYVTASIAEAVSENGKIQISFDSYVYNKDAVTVGPGLSFERDGGMPITKNGAAVELAELAAGDVAAIKYDIRGTLNESSFVEIIATNKTIYGNYRGYDEYGVYEIGENKYELMQPLDWLVGRTYTCRLAPFGRIYDCEEDITTRNFAVVECYIDIDKTDEPYSTDCLRVVTLDGQAKELLVRLSYHRTLQKMMGKKNIGATPEETTVEMANRIIEYRLIDGMVNYVEFVNTETFTQEQYITSSNSLGKPLLKNAIVLDATKYDESNKDMNDYSAASLNALADQAVYDGIRFNRNGRGEYTHIIITKGTVRA